MKEKNLLEQSAVKQLDDRLPNHHHEESAQSTR